MNAAGSDKGWGMRGRHYYTRVYHALFQKLRNQSITIVEIGLLRPDRDNRRQTAGTEGDSDAVATKAPSLEAWRAYFTKAKIVGFDIDDFSTVKIPGVKIIQGDMSNPADLRRLVSECGSEIDIVIDDGSHASHHQQIAFAELYPYLKRGGLYIIEDLHWQDPSLEQATAIKTRHMFQEYRRSGHLVSPIIESSKAQELASQIANVRFFDSIEPYIDDTEDALCVIQKEG